MNDQPAANDPLFGKPPGAPGAAATNAGELFELLLERYDEASAQGHTPRRLDDTQLPEELRRELAGLEECVDLLNAAARQRLVPGPGFGAEAFELDVHAEMPTLQAQQTADTSLDGERIGRFEIIRELGRGGYGVVFLARDPAIGRDVALKLPRPEALVTPELRRRFLREAQAAGCLDHAHVLPAYEVGEDGALCYLVSPYCRGPSLARWLAVRSLPITVRGTVPFCSEDSTKSGPTPTVPVREAAHLVACLADALAHAHHHGVLHRDIKPANVLLDPSSTASAAGADLARLPLSAYVPKLTDFGLAKLTVSADQETRTGALLGTPAYMSPEQAKGCTGQVGEATDIYALGAVLYELLTGRPPLVGESDPETLRLVATVDPTPPRLLRDRLPRDLDAIVLKCLEKSPADRYKSAAALAADLRRFLAGEPTKARPARPVQRAWKWTRRRPAIAGLLGLAIALLATMVIGGQWYSNRLAREQADVLERQYAHDLRAAFEARAAGAVDQAVALLVRHGDGTPGAALRNFEWYWLRGALDETVLAIPSGHREAYSVLFSPDGKLLLSGGMDGVIRAWNVSTGSPEYELRGHTSCVNQIAFLPDGRLVSASCDRTVRLWDLDARREVRVLCSTPTAAMCLTIARGRPWLAVGGLDGRVRVWSTADGSPIVTLVAGATTDAIDAIAFSGDEGVLAATSGTAGGSAWKTRAWDRVQTPLVQALALVRTGKSRQFISGMREHEVIQWDATDPAPPRPLGRVPGEVHCLAVSHSGDIVFAAGTDGSVHALGMNRTAPRIFSGSTSRVQGLALSPDDRYLAAASYDGVLRVWDLAPPDLMSPPTDSPPRAAVISADGRRFITSDVDGAIRVQDAGNPATWANHERAGVPLALSPSGSLLWATHVSGKDHRLLRLPTLEPLPGFDVYPGAVSVSISGDDRVIAVADNERNVRMIDAASGTETRRFKLPTVAPIEWAQLALSGDGGRLVWTETGKLSPIAIDTQTGRHIALPADLAFLQAASIYPGGVRFSPDGRRSAFEEAQAGTWHVRDIATGEDIHRLRHRTELSGNGAWSPDGRRLAIVARDSSVVLFDTRTGEEEGTLDGCPEPIISNLVFSPDGQTLTVFTGGVEGSPGHWRVWQAPRK